MKFKSLPQLLDHFKDEDTCIKYFENLIWNGKPTCPHCKSDNPYKTKAGYKCSNNECYKKFTVKVGTVLENSKIPLRTWFAALFLSFVHKKGISSVQLATDLNVTQKTAWFMLHRIREMMKDKEQILLGNITGIIEADESVMGGIEINRHKGKKQDPHNKEKSMDGKPYNFKKTVIGIVERGGNVVLRHISEAGLTNAWTIVDSVMANGSTIVTDESKIYKPLKREYNHFTVNHSKGVYADGDVHTNTIENFWSVLKRTLYGTYHQVSGKHLTAYLNESAARYNNRGSNPYDNFDKLLANAKGSLLYKVLIAKD